MSSINFCSSVLKVLALASTLTLSMSLSVSAHERFVVPSHTQLSGKPPQTITATASISNAIFHPDRPLGNSVAGIDVGDLAGLFNSLNNYVILPVDGKVQPMNWRAYARMSVADVELQQSGTYRISLTQPDVFMTTFKKADGTPWRVFGANPDIPAGATNIVRRTTSSRVESFVTLNELSWQAVKPQGAGLELGGKSHPNDLFTNEEISFQLLFNGKPISGTSTVKLIAAGTRYRNNREEREIITNEHGEFSLSVKQAGMYFLAASMSLPSDEANIDVRHYGLYLSLEVFPE